MRLALTTLALATATLAHAEVECITRQVSPAPPKKAISTIKIEAKPAVKRAAAPKPKPAITPSAPLKKARPKPKSKPIVHLIPPVMYERECRDVKPALVPPEPPTQVIPTEPGPTFAYLSGPDFEPIPPIDLERPQDAPPVWAPYPPQHAFGPPGGPVFGVPAPFPLAPVPELPIWMLYLGAIGALMYRRFNQRR